MGDEKDNLKKYNTEAFAVPEGEKMGNEKKTTEDMSGNRDGMGGNDSEMNTSTSENGPVGHGEGLEEGSKVGVGSEGGLKGIALETPENGHRVQNENIYGKPLQKHQKRMNGIALAVIMVTLVLVGIAGVIVWDALQQGNQEPVKVDKPVVSEVGKEEKPEEPKVDEVREISIEEPVVQEVYEKFKRFPGMYNLGFLGFYEGINDEQKQNYTMINKAIFEVEPLESCRKQYSEYDMELCYDVTEVNKKAKELFDRDVVATAASDSVFGSCSEYSIYSEDTEEYVVLTGCGGSGPLSLNRWLYKAETNGEELYLYDIATITDVAFMETGEYAGRLYYHTDDIHLKDENLIDLSLDKNEVLASDDDVLLEGQVAVDPAQFADKLDMYKWTFRKNDEGNYVFAGLEKVQ